MRRLTILVVVAAVVAFVALGLALDKGRPTSGPVTATTVLAGLPQFRSHAQRVAAVDSSTVGVMIKVTNSSGVAGSATCTVVAGTPGGAHDGFNGGSISVPAHSSTTSVIDVPISAGLASEVLLSGVEVTCY